MYNRSLHNNTVMSVSKILFNYQKNIFQNSINLESVVCAQSMELTHTGLFVPVDSSTLLLGTASASLQQLCHVRAVIGPTRKEDRTCEILLLPLPPPNNKANFSHAEVILQNYFNLLIKEKSVFNHKTLLEKQKQQNLFTTKASSDFVVTQNSKRMKRKRQKFYNEKLKESEMICLDDTIISSPESTPKVKRLFTSTNQSATSEVFNNDPHDIEIVDLEDTIKVEEKTSSSTQTDINSGNNIKKSSSVPLNEENAKVCVITLEESIVNICDKPDNCKLSSNSNVTVLQDRNINNHDDDDDVVICSDNDEDDQDVVVNATNNDNDSEDVLSIITDSSVIDKCVEEDIILVPNEDKVIGNYKNQKVSSSSSENNHLNNFEENNETGLLSSSSSSKNNVNNSNSKNTNCCALVLEIDNSTVCNKENNRNVTQKLNDNLKDNEQIRSDISIIDMEFSSEPDEIILLSENEGNSDNCIELINMNILKDCKKKKKKKKLRGKLMQKQKFKIINSGNKLVSQLRNMSKEDLIQSGFLVHTEIDDLIRDKNSKSSSNISSKKRKKNKPSTTFFNNNKITNNCCENNNASEDMVVSKTSSCKEPVITNSITIMPSTNLDVGLVYSRPAHFKPQNTNVSKVSLPEMSHHSSSSSNSNNDTVFSITGVVPFRTITTSSTLSKRKHNSSKNLDDVGTNVFVPNDESTGKKTGLRPIIIDGSNVAFSHGRNVDFSFKGIEICINYFKTRGHKVIAIMPNYRKCHVDNKILDRWEKDGTLVFTPSRKVNGKLVVSHDDRYIIQCAAALDGIIVSKDNFRDFIGKNPLWDDTIEQRLLMFTWVGDLLMFPEDPLGRHGPTLDKFLKFPSPPPSSTKTSNKH